MITVLVVAFMAGRRWADQFARAQVTAQLREVNGGPIHFERVSLGLRSLTIHDVQLIEPNSDERVVWCSIDRIWMNISLWDGLMGKTTAERAILYEPVLRLRLSEDGQLLNKFRSSDKGFEPPARDIEIRQAVARFEQGTNPPFSVDDIQARVQQAGSELRVTGSLEKFFNSQWRFEGSIDPTNVGVNGRVSGDGFQVNSADLTSLPRLGFDVNRLGDFAATGSMTATMNWDSEGLDYEATLMLSSLQFELPDQQFETTLSHGKIVARNDEIIASNLTGTLFEGAYVANGQLDLMRMSGEATISFQDMDVRNSPRNWSLPADVDGSVDGTSHVFVTRSADSWHIRGTADAVAIEVSAFGVEPEQVKLNVEFRSPQGDQIELPIGLEGTANIHVEATSIDALQMMKTLHQMRPPTTGEVQNLRSDSPPPWPIEIEGSLSFIGNFAIPLATMDHLNTLSGEGDLASESLKVAALEARGLSAQFVLQEGVVEVTEANAEIRDEDGQNAGRLEATCTAGVVPLAGLSLAAEITQVPLGVIRDLIDKPVEEFPDGLVDSTFSAEVSLADADQLEAWSVEGQSTSAAISFAGENSPLSAKWKLTRGGIVVEDARIRLFGAPVSGTGTLSMTSPYPFQFNGNIQEASLAGLTARIPQFPEGLDVAGTAVVDGQVSGTMVPRSFSGSGNGQVQGGGTRGVDVGDVRFKWILDDKQVRIVELDSHALGGHTQVNATYAFTNTADSILTATLADIDLTTVAKLFGKPGWAAGQISGELKIASWTQPSEASGTLKFNSVSVTSPGTTFGRIQGEIVLANEILKLDASATTHGGAVRLYGNSTIAKLSTDIDTENRGDRFQGNLELQQFPITKILGQRGSNGMLRHLTGIAEAKCKVRLDSAWQPHVDGQVGLRDLRWQRDELSRQLQGRLIATSNTVRLEQINGAFAGGRARLNGDLVIGKSVNGSLRLALERVEASKALVPIPTLAANVSGPVDVKLQFIVGERWTGRGEISMTRGEIMTLPVTRLRAPVELRFAPGQSRLQLSTSNISAEMARGQVHGKLDVVWRNQLQLNASAQAKEVELRSLLRGVPGVRSVGSGRVSGSFNINGRRIESVDDLEGRFQADLSQLQPLQFPVLRQISRFVGPLQPTTAFDSGHATGRLANGIVYLNRTTFDGGVAQLLIDGTTTLRGNLDLNVTAKTGNLSNPPVGLAGLVRSPVSLAAPLPISLLTEANEFLSDRLVYLHIGGTVKRPSVQVQPARQLQQEAIQFFLRRAANAVIDSQSP